MWDYSINIALNIILLYVSKNVTDPLGGDFAMVYNQISTSTATKNITKTTESTFKVGHYDNQNSKGVFLCRLIILAGVLVLGMHLGIVLKTSGIMNYKIPASSPQGYPNRFLHH